MITMCTHSKPLILFGFLFALAILLVYPVPASSDDVQDKLQALDNAYKAGILSDEEYESKRAEIMGGQGRVPTQKQADSKSARAVNPAPARQTGQIYRHPTGISLWYPSGWQAKMLSGILQLVPPGAAATAEAYETYYITAEDVTGQGIHNATHPMVIQYLDDQMQQLGMHLGGIFFQRTGDVKGVTTSQGAGQGVRLDYIAQSSIGPIKGCAYAIIIKNYGLALAGVGVKDLLDRRRDDVHRIFSSLGVGEGKMDPALVGTWNLSSTYAIRNESVWETDYSRAQAVSEGHSRLQFSADGTWIREDKSQMIAGAGSVWLESKESSVHRGKWNADAGHLFMVWKDESFEEYQYRLQGNQLKLRTGKTGQLWTREN